MSVERRTRANVIRSRNSRRRSYRVPPISARDRKLRPASPYLFLSLSLFLREEVLRFPRSLASDARDPVERIDGTQTRARTRTIRSDSRIRPTPRWSRRIVRRVARKRERETYNAVRREDGHAKSHARREKDYGRQSGRKEQRTLKEREKRETHESTLVTLLRPAVQRRPLLARGWKAP